MTSTHTSRSVLSPLNRRQFIQAGALALGTGILGIGASQSQTRSQSGPTLIAQQDLTPLVFGTNWFAQAEHGGFYQGVAKGIYNDFGLDVTVEMGGPQVNGTQLLVAGAIDFFMGSAANAIQSVQEGLPKITVAAIFQKDPQVLLAHPGTGVESLADLKGRPILISAGAQQTYWPFLRAKFGFTDDQIRPYNFNMGPFLQDEQAAQQGYLTSEPYAIEQEGGFAPVVLLLADQGYTPYATTIETKTDLVESDPDLVQRFVDASIVGWYDYFEDPEPANELIKQDNPEMSDEQLAYGLEKMQEFGIVISGDAEEQGIGAMSDERWQALFDSLVDAGSVDSETDYTQAFTLDFINKGEGYYKERLSA